VSVTCDRSGFSPGTPVSSTNKTDRYDIAEILLKVALNTMNQTMPCTTELLLIIQFEEMHKTIYVFKYEIVFIYDYPSTHIPMAAVSKLSHDSVTKGLHLAYGLNSVLLLDLAIDNGIIVVTNTAYTNIV
jgi:hypothetical protein